MPNPYEQDIKDFLKLYKKYKNSKRCKFLYKLLRNHYSIGKYAQHELYIGDSGTGKNHLAFWNYEIGMILGKMKLYYLWCNKWTHLREVLTLLTKFDIRIYMPISQGLPPELPTLIKGQNRKGLIIPFTISTDNLSKTAIHCLTGYKDPQQIYGEYKKLVHEGMNFSQLKKAIWKDSKKDILIEKGYMGRKFVSIHRSNPSTVSGLSRRLATLNHEGILADTRYPYALEKILPHEVHDQKTIVILYTGFVHNEDLQKLTMIYFTDVLQQTLQKYTALTKKQVFKHKLHYNEWEQIAKPKEDKDASVMDLIMGEYLKRLVSDVRHLNGEVGIDVKGLENIDQRVRSKMVNKFVTQLFDDRELSRVTINTPHKPKRLLAIFSRWKERKIYRFIDLYIDIPTWKWKGNREEGYELPRPRLSKDGKMEMELDSFTHIDGVDMRKCFDFTKTKIIQEQHADYLSLTEQRWINEIENKTKEDIKEKEQRQATHDNRTKRIKLMQKYKHDNPDMKKKELVSILRVSPQQVNQDEHYLINHPELLLPQDKITLPLEDFISRLNTGKL